ncbi:type IV pilin [Halomarina oriensis]|uniref:Type IV pilin n=2 Tax=Halomarina oriensis TaxID=671145 RepID=A0A6B0GN86_9EURY|nr:type IV pilin [Halomarina oriensis]
MQKIKSMLNADDRAVSPVIGVILMVAITVILAAVIASLTLGLGDSAQTAPTAKFDFDQGAASGSGDADVTVTHASGASIDADRITVTYSGASPADQDGTAFSGADADNPISAGDSLTLSDVSENEQIKVIWTSEDGGTSSTLATYTVQE